MGRADLADQVLRRAHRHHSRTAAAASTAVVLVAVGAAWALLGSSSEQHNVVETAPPLTCAASPAVVGGPHAQTDAPLVPIKPDAPVSAIVCEYLKSVSRGTTVDASGHTLTTTTTKLGKAQAIAPESLSAVITSLNSLETQNGTFAPIPCPSPPADYQEVDVAVTFRYEDGSTLTAVDQRGSCNSGQTNGKVFTLDHFVLPGVTIIPQPIGR
jgi:hypothetical protein